MARLAMKKMPSADNATSITYDILRVPREGNMHRAVNARLICSVHGGDDGESVLTIMLPNED